MTTTLTRSAAPAVSVRRADARGRTRLGWLDSWHTFSFGEYYDPRFTGFGDLLVINDDRIAAGGGFPMHGHRDMEILTVVLAGGVAHRDSLGTGSVIRPGEVQLMSAGTGIRHSEYNASDREPLHLLQIWIRPDRAGLTPGYQQAALPAATGGAPRLIVSPDGAAGSLVIHQDARVFAAVLAAGDMTSWRLDAGRSGWLQVARGAVAVGDETLSAGDGLAIAWATAQRDLAIRATAAADLLLFDLR
jgi:redox-sensitive bicupin YhaK (pirin superfamily)